MEDLQIQEVVDIGRRNLRNYVSGLFNFIFKRHEFEILPGRGRPTVIFTICVIAPVKANDRTTVI